MRMWRVLAPMLLAAWCTVSASAAEYSFQTLTYNPGEFGLSSSGAGGFMTPLGINDLGVVVGQAGDSETDTFTFTFDSEAANYSVICCTGTSGFFGAAINNGNTIFAYDEYVHDPEGPNPVDGPLVGYTTTAGSFRIPGEPADVAAGGVNDSGQAVGNYLTATSQTDGFLYSGGTISSISVPGAAVTIPVGISNAGEIVGNFEGASTGSGSFLDLGGVIFTNLDNSIGGISSSGEYIVGSNGSGAFVSFDGLMSQFSAPAEYEGITLTGVNDVGQIVGFGNDFGFIATPIPEPASWLIVSLGLLVLSIYSGERVRAAENPAHPRPDGFSVCRVRDSNPQPRLYKSLALAVVLTRQTPPL